MRDNEEAIQMVPFGLKRGSILLSGLFSKFSKVPNPAKNIMYLTKQSTPKNYG